MHLPLIKPDPKVPLRKSTTS